MYIKIDIGLTFYLNIGQLFRTVVLNMIYYEFAQLKTRAIIYKFSKINNNHKKSSGLVLKDPCSVLLNKLHTLYGANTIYE